MGIQAKRGSFGMFCLEHCKLFYPLMVVEGVVFKTNGDPLDIDDATQFQSLVDML